MIGLKKWFNVTQIRRIALKSANNISKLINEFSKDVIYKYPQQRSHMDLVGINSKSLFVAISLYKLIVFIL